ncbi:flagellar biosynthesis protein FlhB [Ponticaulis sp.]|uniref:flagellar biosynthesis protein FlhB n=1 Tax=Ponticaulis sp. TaxID=2020902 RepID=UPI000B66F588|nr:flagellar biosynthesis protein FlhB [Ponticaulis sp.]MAI90478.1 flagellar biosynthesis protein FlhB [Ponticaulis sp.]OUY00175.1 MAG: flagellar biosynthesis protein FlhB [Hyphomonadaceae bacterium TMED5]|tara:strand:+ start:97887 stop:98951 length:1065 start_codon:yes stop_codon:yes gene_type:complete
MAEEQDKSQKTEEPTQKRLDDARKKGDAVRSQDVPIWFMMLAIALLIAASGPIMRMIARPLVSLLDHPHAFRLEDGGAMQLTEALVWSIAPPAAIVFSILTFAALTGHLIQNRPAWTFEKMKPKLSKLSPMEGLKRILGPQGWMNLFKSILKLGAIAGALLYAVWPDISLIERAGAMELAMLAGALQSIAGRLLIATLFVVGIIAAIDYLFQKQQFDERMKMSRQEIKDEHKQSEGDPQVKAKIRQLRMEKSRRRMMAAVPEASVIVTNPTHYSVALKYDDDTPAPKVIAKGVDDLALRIREIAEEHDIPLVENPPLARALYARVEVDETIPREHYEAVAKIISFVMRAKKSRW